MYFREPVEGDEDTLRLTWEGAELVSDWYHSLKDAGLTPLDSPIALNIGAGYIMAHDLVPEDLAERVEDDLHTTVMIFLSFAANLEKKGVV